MAAWSKAVRLCALALAGVWGAAPASANDEVLRMLGQDVARKTARLGEQERECARKEAAAPPLPALPPGLSRTQLATGVGYLAQRNRFACTHAELAELLYAATVLDRARQDYGQPPQGVADALATATQPGPRYFELALDYARLPEAARSALEQALGTQPFDLSAALRAIPRE